MVFFGQSCVPLLGLADDFGRLPSQLNVILSRAPATLGADGLQVLSPLNANVAWSDSHLKIRSPNRCCYGALKSLWSKTSWLLKTSSSKTRIADSGTKTVCCSGSWKPADTSFLVSTSLNDVCRKRGVEDCRRLKLLWLTYGSVI